jgi:hypothetical protein
LFYFLKFFLLGRVLVAQSSYSGGRDQKDQFEGSPKKPKYHTKIRLVEWLKQ